MTCEASQLDVWADKRARTQRLASTLSLEPKIRARASAIAHCADVLTPNSHGDIRPSYPCGDALCPSCEGRWFRRAAPYLHGLPALLEALGAASCILFSLVLTVPNVAVLHLRRSLTELHTRTRRFLSALEYRTDSPLSYLRKFEVSRAEDGRAHPHAHVMLATPVNTFDRYSLSGLWCKTAPNARTEQPYTHWQAFSAEDPAVEAHMRYILKPAVRVTDAMLDDPPFILGLARGLANVRTLASSGLFRQCRNVQSVQRSPYCAVQTTRYSWHDGCYQRQ